MPRTKPIKVGDDVRLLKAIRFEGRAIDYTPGYLVNVSAVNPDGTLVVTRDDVQNTPPARATVKLEDVEQAHQVVGGTYYSSKTPRSVIKILEEARESGRKVRVHYGNRETGKDWLDEWDVYGTIGRSMGPIKIPLMICDGDSGGPGIMDGSIVKIRVGGNTVYKHPKYHTGNITVRPVGKKDLEKFPDLKGYQVAVDVDGGNHANFPTMDDAVKWMHKLGLTIKSITGRFRGEVVCTG